MHHRNCEFNISAFTDVGTFRKNNQDGILVNGQFSNKGFINTNKQSFLSCFVADGVGGNNAGEFASKFVLEEISNCKLSDLSQIDYEYLEKINQNLIGATKKDQKLTGAATTLSGIICLNATLKIIHAGDSEIWLLRNDSFIKVTNDQVLSAQVKNSPITSYFGGKENYLSLDNTICLEEIKTLDKFLICSDGLFKALKTKQLKAILGAKKTLQIKIEKILEMVLENGAEDNVSVILIEAYA
tara:strand:+ start:30238 stop:30963 length:726 start_codon:yes stop_codon:yes gene_type:complete